MHLSSIAILLIAFFTTSALSMPVPESGPDTVCTLLLLPLTAMVDFLWKHKPACKQVLSQLLTPAQIAQIKAKPGRDSKLFRGLKLPDGKEVDAEVFPPGTSPAVIEGRKKQLGSSLLASSCQILVYNHKP